jgi:peptide/nickel transport system substrate-binding protein/oligopeptide transport system substrate-binding protein
MAIVLPWDQIRKDYNLPATTFIYPLRGYPEIKGLDQSAVDMAKAKEMLRQAGYPGGKGISSIVLRIPDDQESQRIAGLMAKAWKDNLDLPCKVEVISNADYFNYLKKDGYDVGMTTWIGDFADPITFLALFQANSNLNDAKYSDSEYEALIAKSATEDGTERWKTLGQAEQMLLDKGVVLPIAHNWAVNVISTNEIGGWYTNALDIHPFKYLYYKGWKPIPGLI